MGEPPGRGPTRWQELTPSIGPGGAAARRRIVQAPPIHKEFSAVRRKLSDVDGRIGLHAMTPPGGNSGLISAAFDQYLALSAAWRLDDRIASGARQCCQLGTQRVDAQAFLGTRHYDMRMCGGVLCCFFLNSPLQVVE